MLPDIIAVRVREVGSGEGVWTGLKPCKQGYSAKVWRCLAGLYRKSARSNTVSPLLVRVFARGPAVGQDSRPCRCSVGFTTLRVNKSETKLNA